MDAAPSAPGGPAASVLAALLSTRLALSPALQATILGTVLLMLLAAWGLVALSRREREAARLAAVIGPHRRARAPGAARPRSALSGQAAGLLRTLAGLFGIDRARAHEYPVPWWGVLLGLLPLARVPAGLIATLVGDWAVWLTPLLWVVLARAVFGHFASARQEKLYRQFPDALATITRAVRVGIPVTEAMRSVSRSMPEPTAREFADIVDRLSVGVPLDEALEDTARRNGLPEYRFFAAALSLQAQTGGGLAETLDNLADVIRKRVALKARAIALSSEAKTSAWILGALPFVTMAALAVTSPSYIESLFNEPSGQRILTIAMGMLLMGVLVMRSMIRRSLS